MFKYNIKECLNVRCLYLTYASWCALVEMVTESFRNLCSSESGMQQNCADSAVISDIKLIQCCNIDLSLHDALKNSKTESYIFVMIEDFSCNRFQQQLSDKYVDDILSASIEQFLSEAFANTIRIQFVIERR